MRSIVALTAGAVAAVVGMAAATPAGDRVPASTRVAPSLQSIGPLAFGPGGVLYAADPQAATIFALELGAAASPAVAGTKSVAGIDQQIAALLGTGAAEISITDLIVDPRTRNTYLSVMRGQGTNAKPVLLRVDGAGKIEIVSFETMKFSSVTLPNAPDANPTARNNPRTQSVMDMAFQGGKLYVAGLSNEEFSSKLWAVPYPFASADRGTSVEIFHGNHGGLETRSPVYTFVAHSIGNEPYLIGGYLCTPLVKFPVAALAPGAKIRGTTIAELGSQNRPIDMIVYTKDGKEYLLMSNTSRGVMKIPTDRFATEAAITARVPTGTAGVPFETIASFAGVTQLDLLDATHAVVLTRTAAGALNLESVILP
jgi:hypothetical protein